MTIYIKKINALLTKQDKKLFISLIVFSIIVAVIETIGISIIMPFISVASDFSLIKTNEYYKSIYDLFSFSSEIYFVVSFGIILILFYIFRGGINLLYFYSIAKFSKERTHLLAYKLFENYLGMSYHQFINKNSSELSKSMINETQYLTIMLYNILLMISELFVAILIYSVMLYINWKITLLITILLGINVFFLVKKISTKIKIQGSLREDFQKYFYEIINSSFGNFKLIKLQSNDNLLVEKFKEASYGFAKSGIIYDTLKSFPRIFLETIGFSLIAFMVLLIILIQQTDISNILGLLSMFVLGLYRLMPSANRLLTSYNQIIYYHKSLEIIHNDLMYNGENLGDNNLKFDAVVKLNNISFGYIEEKLILENIDLSINKGSKIAFIGPSGCGKSTLVDIIIGLYKPVSGSLFIDNEDVNEFNIKSWRKKVGYIPQNVYLIDGTVAENIAFGQKYDENKIKEVLSNAKILEFLEIHHEGLNTFVGEGGIKLSGGQKQRIAIARALYQDPDILVLDEATSALDEEIESQIMDEIYSISEDKTLIIIAHRLSTIDRCEKVYTIENRRLRLKNEK